jgi:cation diffusion facilitator CzcD-associated flavoprotein CzcO
MGQRREFRVVIVGTGFSGLGMAIQLKKAGITDFVVLEKADEIGGTWRDNSYPGCACDIPSLMYSFSYEQNPNWSRAYSAQPEIFEYLRDVAAKHELYDQIHFGHEVAGAAWDEASQRWTVRTAAGAEYVGQFLISGVGALHMPMVPELEGIENFAGPRWHSAEWNHQVDLAGKRVAVVGTGASAIQFVPQIAPEVAELRVFQRTAPWIMPKTDHRMPDWAIRLFNRFPPSQRAFRGGLYWLLESRAMGFNGNPWMMKIAERLAKWHARRAITDPELRAKVTPDYTLGCKRVLISNDFYPALNRDNVHLITDGITEVRPNSIVDAAGAEHEIDVLIYGTGFHVTDALDYLDIKGRNGTDLASQWRDSGVQTHLGMTVSGFPNLFFMLGPNTGLGHNSVVFMIESQARYILSAIRTAARNRVGSLDVRPDVQDQFQDEIQRKLSGGIWSTGGCTSWYLDSHGVNRSIWPGFTFRYWSRTRRFRPEEFQFATAAPAPLPVSVTEAP